MRKNSLKNSRKAKAVVFAAGCAMSVLFLELVLRVIGAYDYDRHPFPGRQDDGGKVILCLGDSYTYGMGVSREEAYPAQLQQLIDNLKGRGTYRVVNGGVLGQNTAQLSVALPNELKKYRPAAVVMLTGGSNSWNVWGYGSFKAGKGYDNSSQREDKLSVLKIGRLALILAEPLRNGRFGSATLSSLWSSLRHDLGRSFGIQILGLISEKLGRVPSALHFYSKAVKINPSNAGAIAGAGRMRMRMERTERLFTERRIGGWPGIRECEEVCGVKWRTAGVKAEELSNCYAGCIRKEPDNYQYYARYIQAQSAVSGGKPRPSAEIAGLMKRREDLREAYLRTSLEPDSFMGGWREKDIRSIVEKCRSAGAVVFVMNYPQAVHGTKSSKNVSLERFRKAQDTVFVDNKAEFAKLLRDNVSPEKLFLREGFQGGFGHWSPAGNKIVAENVFNVMEKAGFFAKP
ncbi:MAG: hypothetical protein ABIG11_09535 [bacterium]